MTTSDENRLATALGVLILTLAAVALRLAGIGHGLPIRLEPDAVSVYRQVEDFWGRVENEATAHPPARAYPTLVARVAGLLPDPRVVQAPAADLEEHLRRAAAPFVTIRTAVALLSALIVPATWLLARCFLAPAAAFLAAALPAVSLLDLSFSQVCRPHAPAAAFATLAVAAALHLRRRPVLSAYVLAALAAGLAIGALQSGALVLGSLAVAHVLQRSPAGRRGVLLPLLALALVIAVGLFFYPRTSTPTTSPDTAMGGYFVLSGHRIYYSSFQGAGFGTLLRTLWSMENVTSVMALIGLSFWLVRVLRARFVASEHADLFVALAYVLPYLLIFGLLESTGERLAIQLLPFVACAAAYGWVRVHEHLPLPRWTGALVAAAMIAIPAIGWIRWVARREPDNMTLAARWLQGNVEPSARVQLVPPLELPLLRDAQALEIDKVLGWSSPWRRYLSLPDTGAVIGPTFNVQTWPLTPKAQMGRAAQDPVGFLAEQGAEYVVISALDEATPFLRDMRAGLRAGAKLLFRTPTTAGQPIGTPGRIMTWQLLGDCQARGHPIEIYGIEP